MMHYGIKLEFSTLTTAILKKSMTKLLDREVRHKKKITIIGQGNRRRTNC